MPSPSTRMGPKSADSLTLTVVAPVTGTLTVAVSSTVAVSVATAAVSVATGSVAASVGSTVDTSVGSVLKVGTSVCAGAQAVTIRAISKKAPSKVLYFIFSNLLSKVGVTIQAIHMHLNGGSALFNTGIPTKNGKSSLS